MPKVSRAGRRDNSQTRSVPQTSVTGGNAGKPLHKTREMAPRTRVISLVVGDILCFIIFTTIGSNQHGEGVNLLYSTWLAIPFALAWFLVSPFMGGFRADIATQPRKMAGRTALSWLIAWPIAMALRWLLVDRVKTPAPTVGEFFSFAVVAFLFNITLLLIWRWPFAWNNEMRKRGI